MTGTSPLIDGITFKISNERGQLYRDFSGVPYVTFRVRAYGDFKFATKVKMTTQVSAGTATGGLTVDWVPMSRGWKLPLSLF